MEDKISILVNELMEVCTACNNHRLSENPYTAPGFVEFIDRPLNINDIPMQSDSIRNETELTKDPSTVPWEDSIKNFVLDLVSVENNKKFSRCILLTEFGYLHTESTATLIVEKYGNNSAVIVDVVPIDDNGTAFEINIRRNNKIEYNSIVDKEYIISTLSVWYIPNDTIIFCHDSFISEYKDTISMMPESTWSISCNLSNFVNNDTKNCKYICPVYSHLGSMETRAVGSGDIRFKEYETTNLYLGRMNYYSRCIRGSRHSSGRCYDCQILYKVLVPLQQDNKQTSNKTSTKFVPSFLELVDSER